MINELKSFESLVCEPSRFFFQDKNNGLYRFVNEQDFNAIQANAIKHGMELAAEVCNRLSIQTFLASGADYSEAVRAAAENYGKEKK